MQKLSFCSAINIMLIINRLQSESPNTVFVMLFHDAGQVVCLLSSVCLPTPENEVEEYAIYDLKENTLSLMIYAMFCEFSEKYCKFKNEVQ